MDNGYIQTANTMKFYSSAVEQYQHMVALAKQILPPRLTLSCGHEASKAILLHDEVDCSQCSSEREASRWVTSLENLQWIDRCQQREVGTSGRVVNYLDAESRARVSAAWSTELRAKVAASEAEKKSREVSVVLEYDVEDDPWCTWGPR